MRETTYQLILNHITGYESMTHFGVEFDNYLRMATLYLNHKGKILFKEDILNQYREGVTLDQIITPNSQRYQPGFYELKNGKREQTWYDVESMEEIKNGDDFFDYFFTCRLRHMSLFAIKKHLSFHLDYSFDGQRHEYADFLTIMIREYEDTLLNPKIIETVRDWIKENSIASDSREPLSGPALDDKVKGRISRQAGDRLTTLNQNQTALLIQFMQKSGIILKEEHLTYTQAGKAFSLLTGYSSHTLRQQLGTKGEIIGVKHEDYKELHDTIMKMAGLIEAKIHKK